MIRHQNWVWLWSLKDRQTDRHYIKMLSGSHVIVNHVNLQCHDICEQKFTPSTN